MLIVHVVISVVSKRNSRIYPTSTVSSKFASSNPVDYSVREMLQEKVYKAHITDLDEQKQRLRTTWVKLGHVVIGQPFISDVIASYQLASRLVMDISSSVSDFRQHTVSVDVSERFHAICRPILALSVLMLWCNSIATFSYYEEK